jgi:hypothetical protein
MTHRLPTPPAPGPRPASHAEEERRQAIRIESERDFQAFAESVRRSSEQELEQALRSR